MRGELLEKFVQKPTEEDTLLGRYLETKRVFYKKGQAPIETYDVEKLRLIENVPYKPRCFRSVIPNKPKRKRYQSAAPFGRSDNPPIKISLSTQKLTNSKEKLDQN